jgi:hypothetical protein
MLKERAPLPDCTPPGPVAAADESACCAPTAIATGGRIAEYLSPIAGTACRRYLPAVSDTPEPVESGSFESGLFGSARSGPEPVGVRTLIADNLRRLRTESGIDLEHISRAAKAHGLDWTPGWLAGVEKGTRQLSAEALVALPVVLCDAFSYRITLADLLAGDAPVTLGAGQAYPRVVTVPSAYLREVVAGPPVRRPFILSAPAPEPEVDPVAQRAQRLRDIRDAGLGDVDIRALASADAGAGPLEPKLAKRLDVPVGVVIAAAASRWGHSATEEQAARVATGEPAARVTREITAELSARLLEARIALADEAYTRQTREYEAQERRARIFGTGEQRTLDPQSPETRRPETRRPESQSPETRSPDPRSPETRSFESRRPEPATDDEPAGDPRPDPYESTSRLFPDSPPSPAGAL